MRVHRGRAGGSRMQRLSESVPATRAGTPSAAGPGPMAMIPSRPHQLDDKLVGITFIDVLFALVIGQLLQPFATTRQVTLAGTAHLLVGGVVTIASWIGYH